MTMDSPKNTNTWDRSDNTVQQGCYEVTFNDSQLTSGVYFYRLQAGFIHRNEKARLAQMTGNCS